MASQRVQRTRIGTGDKDIFCGRFSRDDEKMLLIITEHSNDTNGGRLVFEVEFENRQAMVMLANILMKSAKEW